MLDADDESELLDDHDLIEEPPRYPQATRFVGRKAQLERLHAIVKEAARGEVAFVALTGPAGVGKTRLVEELSKQLTRKPGEPGARMLIAAAGGPGAPPFAAFERLLRQRFGLTAAMAPSSVARELAAAVAELHAGLARDGGHAPHRAAASACPISESPVVEPLAETPAQLEARTFIALKRLLGRRRGEDAARSSPSTTSSAPRPRR